MKNKEFTDSIANDCVHYRGDGPCQPHAKDGVTCRCDSYVPLSRKLLFVMLSSRSDVVRSSVVLNHIKGNDPNCWITCVTHWPELLPSFVNESVRPAQCGILRIQNDYFDMAVNFGIDREGCALMGTVQAGKSYGFNLKRGSSNPIDEKAESLWHKMLFPAICNITPDNKYSYRQNVIHEMFELCQIDYHRQLPEIELDGIRSGNPGQFAVVVNRNGKSALANKVDQVVKGIQANSLAAITLEVPGESEQDGFYSVNGSLVSIIEQLPRILASSEVVVTDQIWVAEYAWATGRRIILVNGKPESKYSDSDFIGRGRVVPEDIDIESLISVITGFSIAYDDNASASKLLDELVTNFSPARNK